MATVPSHQILSLCLGLTPKQGMSQLRAHCTFDAFRGLQHRARTILPALPAWAVGFIQSSWLFSGPSEQFTHLWVVCSEVT